MLKAVEKGLFHPALSNDLKKKVYLAFDLLANWDYKYEKEKPEGAVMEAWEFMLSTYMHETKISDVRLRRGILSIPMSEGFLYN